MPSFARRDGRVGRSVLIVVVAAAVVVPPVLARTQAVPTNATAPTIAVPPTVGDTLSANQGAWTSSPTTFAYQWLKCPATGGSADGSDCTAVVGATQPGYPVGDDDVSDRFRVRVTATNADGSGTAVSGPTLETVLPPGQNITGCPPVQEAGPLSPDEVNPPARLVIDRKESTPSVITRSTQSIQLRFHVTACDGRDIRGVLVYATPTPFQQFTSAERETGSGGWVTMTLRRQRFFPATPQQQNLVVFVRARKSSEPLLEGISSRRLVSFRVRL